MYINAEADFIPHLWKYLIQQQISSFISQISIFVKLIFNCE